MLNLLNTPKQVSCNFSGLIFIQVQKAIHILTSYVLIKLLVDKVFNDQELVEVLDVEASLEQHLVLVVADRRKG